MTIASVPKTGKLVVEFFPSERHTAHFTRALASLLEDFIGAPDLGARLDGLVELKHWITSDGMSPAGFGVP